MLILSHISIGVFSGVYRYKSGKANIAVAAQWLILRSYFQSANTGKQRWDEPPSGLFSIVHTAPYLWQMMCVQMKEMKVVKATYPEATPSALVPVPSPTM